MTASIITQLRDVVPLRPLTVVEALNIAELQAAKFLELTETSSPPVSDKLISELPRVQVDRTLLALGSGATQWSRGRWLVLINGSEPRTRQRFTLAHEFKHILDGPFRSVIYPRVRGDAGRHWQIESYCDQFAACFLMPRVWVRRQWAAGVQDPHRLAMMFDVSRQAMATRLRFLGLTEPRSRCEERVWHRESANAARRIAA